VDTVLARIVTREVSPFVLVLFRNLFGLLVLAPWLAAGDRRAAFATRRPFLHIARAALKLLGLAGFFYGLSVVPVAEATAIAFATPLFAAAGAAAFLGETLRHGRLAAILVGFLGVLIVLRPGGGALHPGALAVLASAVALAAIGLLAKVLARHDPPRTIVAINLTFPCRWRCSRRYLLDHPSLAMLGLMAVQGALGAGSQICFIRALRLADASLDDAGRPRPPAAGRLAGLPRLRPVPDGWTWAGAVVICAASSAPARGRARPNPGCGIAI
jgi:drug/metabolite transporter (DMT)-like permease